MEITLTRKKQCKLMNRMQVMQEQSLNEKDRKKMPKQSIFEKDNVNPVHIEGLVVADSMKELMNCLRYKDTEELRQRLGMAHPDLIDAKLLTVLEQTEMSQTTVNWMMFEGPPGIRNRDVIFVERMGVTLDAKGKEVGFIVSESIDLEILPEELKHTNSIRADLQWVLLFKWQLIDHHLINSSITGYMDPNGLLPAWAVNKYNAFGQNDTRFDRYMSMINSLCFKKIQRHKKKFPSQRSRNNCIQCFRKFTPTRPKHRCFVCKDSFCKSCVQTRYYSINSLQLKKKSRTFKLESGKFCMQCVRNCCEDKDEANISTVSHEIVKHESEITYKDSNDMMEIILDLSQSNESLDGPASISEVGSSGIGFEPGISCQKSSSLPSGTIDQCFDFNAMIEDIEKQKDLLNAIMTGVAKGSS